MFSVMPSVERRVDAVHADERRQTFHRRVFQNHLRERLLPLRHRGERNVLRGVGNALNHASVLHGEKSFWHDDIE
jgi:hypothetical protein